MAIIIPSRNIYEKDNDKIRDNKIDRIEVGAFDVVPNNEYETPVYNEDIIVENLISFENENKENSSQTRNSGGYSYEDTIDYVYLDNIFKYKEGRIIIPKNRNNKFISKIFKGENEEKKIGFLVNGNTIKKQISSTVLYTGYDEVGGKYYTKKETIYGEETENKTGAINFPDFPFSISSSSGGILNNNKASITGLQNETEVPISFSSDNLNYYIDYKILVYAKLEYLKGGANSLRGGLNTFPYPYNLSVSGSCDIYEGNEIEITVYGNTIGIDLNDKTVIVGDERGDNVFSIEGNELLQTSNYIDKQTELKKGVDYTLKTESLGLNNYKHIFTFVKTPSSNIDIIFLKNGEEVRRRTSLAGYKTFEYIYTPTLYDEIKVVLLHTNSIEESYKNTIIQYENGKETATIRCAIADYSNGVVAFLQSYARQGNSISATFAIRDNNIPNLSSGEYVKVNELVGYVNRPYSNGTIGVLFENLDSIYQAFEKHKEYAIVKFGDEAVSPYSQGKMIFSQYDEVIPMVYGANGQDKPLSKKQDGSPKEFVVLSSRVFYDGAVWQELILQEK